MTTEATVHPDDDQLLEVVLGWVSDETGERERAHVAACALCTARAARLRARTGAVLGAIAEVELPPGFAYPALPPRPSRPALALAPRARPARAAWLRAAALVIVLLAGTFAAVPPLRAWVAGWVESWRATPEQGAAVAPAEADGVEVADGEPASRLLFTPAGAEFRIEVQHSQAAGWLEVRSADGTHGSVEVLGEAAEEMPVVREGGLALANRPGSRASYRVVLPPTVVHVEVRIGGRAAVALTGERLRAGYRTGLAEEGGR